MWRLMWSISQLWLNILGCNDVNIFKFEGHAILVVVSMIQHEGCHGSTQRVHLNLVIPRVCICEIQHAIALRPVDEAIDVWKRVWILGQATFRLVKSTHMIHLVLPFSTWTLLASQVGYFVSMTNPTLYSFSHFHQWRTYSPCQIFAFSAPLVWKKGG